MLNFFLNKPEIIIYICRKVFSLGIKWWVVELRMRDIHSSIPLPLELLEKATP
jgi:hypothetical protein